ncbi:hypothetical protein FDECE_12879 [Fusarium decemcellulare]|nr:hypothetical protein FDECE_12879 [Fusarium decemcellulare]
MPSSTADPQTKRRHVTTACVPCRRSKTRCNGVSPTCNSCEAKDRECRYAVDEDKRKSGIDISQNVETKLTASHRRLSLRLGVKLLARRVDQLCQFIRDNSLEPPEMAKEDHTILTNVLNQLYLSLADPEIGKKTTGPVPPLNAKTASPKTPQAVMTASTPQSLEVLPAFNSTDGAGEEPTQQETSVASLDISGGPNTLPAEFPLLVQMPGSGRLLEPPAFSVPGAASFPSPESIVGQFGDISANLYEPDKATSEVETTEILVEQLVDRFGSLKVKLGVTVHHHGPTSGFNLVHLPDPEYMAIDRNVRSDGDSYLESRGVGKAVPFELVQHLVDLYFTWQNPNLYIVDRITFNEARICWCNIESDTPYYSEALLNSMQVLCLPSHVELYILTSHRCASGAAFESRHHPTFDTSPRSLSDFFAERAKILLEIELDHPSVATVQALAILAGHELGCNKRTRGWLYSGTMWSSSVGYPSHINLDDVSVLRPCQLSTSQPAGHWASYGSKRDALKMAPLPDCQYKVHCERIKLCEIVSPLVHALYGKNRVPLSSFPDIKGSYAQELLHWQSSLPSTLQVDIDDLETVFLPHGIHLHIQYHHSVILTHRPWMSRSNNRPFLSQYPSTEFARMKCVASAIAIAKLLRIHEVHYGIRKMNALVVGMACSAASILLFAMLTNYFCEDAGRHLNTCLRVLDELSVTFESSRRAHAYIMLLQRKWQTQQRSALTNINSRPSKRICMALEQATPEQGYAPYYALLQ